LDGWVYADARTRFGEGVTSVEHLEGEASVPRVSIVRGNDLQLSRQPAARKIDPSTFE
jgi:hypothetical protein